MTASRKLVERIRPVLLNPAEADPFWACYTEDIQLAQRIAASHPSLFVYTISSWGDENWVHRGLRIVNRMGYLFGIEDMGESYAELLWHDHDESTE
jgi:hypothetical protein